MHGDWITSPTARHVLAHWADPRPAWLWSHDGATLLWRNPAARFVRAKLKKSGLKLSAEAVPIRGQVQRLIRLGRPGQSSLARVQFLAGEKPLALTCACMPVELESGETGLLLVGQDKVDKDIREAAADLGPDRLTEALLPAGTDYLLIVDGAVRAGSAGAMASEAPRLAHDGLPQESNTVVVIKAGPKDQILAIYRSTDAHTDAPAEVAAAPEVPVATPVEPELPMGLDPPTMPSDGSTAEPPPGDAWVPPLDVPSDATSLSSLFDRLADDAQLYSGLSPADEVFTGPPPDLPAPISAAELEASEQFAPLPDAIVPIRAEEGETADDSDAEPVTAPAPVAEPDLADMPELMLEIDEDAQFPASPPTDMIASVIAYADEDTPPAEDAPSAAVPPPPESPVETQQTHWMITGRGFRPLAPTPEVPAQPPEDLSAFVAQGQETLATVTDEPADVATVDTVDAAPDAEAVERVTRYNFEELGRILTDRVAGEGRSDSIEPPARNEGVVSLTAETLVLNRLPLAIVVFRDQQVLFANRALTDLLAYESVEALRVDGIAAIFPAADASVAGPVNQLVRRDGGLMPVSARLQSVSWQGRPALMLSATTVERSHGHESAVRAFAEIAADARGEGFIAADRAGSITTLSIGAAAALGRSAEELTGKPLAVIVSPAEMDGLRAFLEKPARFAETTRPALTVATEDGAARMTLFAEGQAGTVTGYFGFVRSQAQSPTASRPAPDSSDDPALLGRLSRGLRRPLNSVIGFADMIRTADAATPHSRLVEYAQDIRTAGLEIAVLADELDDYNRLNGAERPARQSEIDLQALLENCAIRVKGQAGVARVLVRTAIAERLPLIRGDRAALSQALLNLLASAIDTTPVGGSVILSAQLDDDGNIAVHVRDGAEMATDMAERFMVFRDGLDKEGAQLDPVRSAMGLALTRTLLAVNDCSLSIDPTAGVGTLFTLQIPAELIVAQRR